MSESLVNVKRENRMKFTKFVLLILVLMLLLLSTSCYFFDFTCAPKPQGDLVGEWKMNRLNVNPNMEGFNLLIDHIISAKPTWKITRQNARLAIRYDGRDTWYNSPFGIDVKKDAVTTWENAAKTECFFASGGSVFIGGLTIFVINALLGKDFKQISVTFDDHVDIKLVSKNAITATIRADVKGNFLEKGVSKPIKQIVTVIYSGARNPALK